jgi:hypothetical protein
MLVPMPEDVLPVDAVRGDARHRDVRPEVFAVVPQRAAPLKQRILWRVVLFVARFASVRRWLLGRRK